VIRLRVDTERRRGPVDEFVNVYAANPTRPVASLHMRGRVVRLLELAPQDRVYFFTTVGDTATTELAVINHAARPVHVTGLASDNPIFTARSEVVQDGTRYRISVALDPRTRPGKHEGTITMTTDSPAFPAVPIVTLAVVDDVVNASPGAVSFNPIPFEAVGEPVIGEKQVVVRKHRGTDFKVLRATADVPFLTVEVAPRTPGESFFVNVKIDKARARRGDIRGTLVIETNDPAFPELRLPITGRIV
jgi:hypothetical protein